MSEQDRSPHNLNILEQIDNYCAEFRREWKTGLQPRIESYLKKVPNDAQAHLFKSLLLLDIRYRERQGETPRPSDYVTRFSEFKQVIGDAFHQSSASSLENIRERPRPGANVDHTVTIAESRLKQIGDYELLSELGRGGFGVVYEARHLKRGNVVALKTLPASTDGQDINADRLYKFRREFRSLSEINHPNLVGMQTLEVADDQWFFTMDLVDGVDFLSFVRPNDQLNIGRLRDSMKQLVAGLIALHERNIVHRDVKPSNVLVESDGQLLILDFGLVAPLQKATDQTASMKSAMFAGTPRYAAPEQMFGERSEASDWYAAGTMLYEALTGDPPFTGTHLELLRDKQVEDPAILEGVEGLPVELSQLADALVRRDPAQRPNALMITQLLEMEGDTRSYSSTGSGGTYDEEDPELLASLDEDIILVGREEQLAKMHGAHQELIDHARPVVVWISGLSGEGKSVLAEKFLRPLRRNGEALVLSGRCYDRESVPFKVVDSIIPPLVSYLRSRPRAEIEESLPEDIAFLVRLFPLLRRVDSIASRSTVDLSQIESERVKHRAFRALRELLHTISSRVPLVILVDDLQWADSESAPVIFDLINDHAAPRILLLGSYRRDEADESPFLNDWRILSSEYESVVSEHQVEVRPLTHRQCLELAELRTGIDQSLLESRADQLLNDSGGNPYFFERLLEGFDRETGEFEHIPVEDMIDARLKNLPSDARAFLEIVAVSGHPIALDEVARAAGILRSAVATVTHMRSERLVRLIGASDEARIDTYHDKIREAVLSQLEDDRKRELHLSLAETIESEEDKNAEQWIESLSHRPNPGDYEFPVSARVFDLAHHFVAANDQRAFVYRLLAAETAMQAYAVDDAMAQHLHLKSMLPPDAPMQLRYRLAMAIGLVRQWNKDIDEAIETFREAFDFAKDEMEKAKALIGLANVYRQVGKYDDSLEVATKALRHLGIRRTKSSIGSALSIIDSCARMFLVPTSWHKSRTELGRGKFRLAHEVFDTSGQDQCEKSGLKLMRDLSHSTLIALRSGNRARISVGYGQMACLFSFIGASPISKFLIRRANRFASPEDDLETQGFRAYWEALVHYFSGDLAAAEKGFEASSKLLERCHSLVNLLVCDHMYRHVVTYLHSTTFELESARSVHKLAHEVGNPQGLFWGEYDVATALARQGDIAESLEYMQAANQVVVGERFYMSESIRYSTEAFVRIQCSDYQGARDCAANAARLVWQSWIYMDPTMLCLPMLIEASAGPNWKESTPLATRRTIKRLLRRTVLLYPSLYSHQPHLMRGMARLNSCLGKQGKAIRQLQKGIRLAEAKGMDYQRARCMLDLAAIRDDRSDKSRSEAIALLKRVEAVIPRCEAWLLAEQFDEEVVAPELDLVTWETEHGPIHP